MSTMIPPTSVKSGQCHFKLLTYTRLGFNKTRCFLPYRSTSLTPSRLSGPWVRNTVVSDAAKT